MSAILRFAPSPTGRLHIGNLRTALFNWLFAMREGGQFILRFDDTDRERSRREYADLIETDLRWIGIEPHRIARQSERIALYDAAAETLKTKGLLYPCYETPDELDRKRKRQAARGLPPVYGREALKLSPEERAAREAEGRKPHWRFLLPNFSDDPFAPKRTDVTFDDLIKGRQTIDLASLSDPVLIRGDGSYLYTLPSVVDDAEMGVTHIIRGDDHVTNTAVQYALFEALGAKGPVFGHHNLLTTVGGEGLSKRSGALSLETLRDEGFEPMAVASLAVLVGMSGSIEPVSDLERLSERLNFREVSASASKFDPAELDRLNREIVHGLEFEAVAGRVANMDIPADCAESFWLAVRANCDRVRDAWAWAEIVFGTIETPPPQDDGEATFRASAARLLPEGDIGAETFKEWTARIKSETGLKGKALFLPLRRAITGLDHGPELGPLLPLIGRERLLARLQ